MLIGGDVCCFILYDINCLGIGCEKWLIINCLGFFCLNFFCVVCLVWRLCGVVDVYVFNWLVVLMWWEVGGLIWFLVGWFDGCRVWVLWKLVVVL